MNLPFHPSRRLVVAGVVVALAVTPTLVDAHETWCERPHLRTPLLLWYAFVAVLAWQSWRVF